MINMFTNSVVKIYATRSFPDYGNPWNHKSVHQAQGSGFIFKLGSDIFIMTNAHVIDFNTSIRIKFPDSSKSFFAKKPIVVANELDLAILKVDSEEFCKKAIPLMFATKRGKMGDKITVHGFPKGGTNYCRTEGTISRIQERIYSHSRLNILSVQITAMINHGNSGGPVICEKNKKVVGVIRQISPGNGLSYAVPLVFIQQLLKQFTNFKGIPGLNIFYNLGENELLRKFFAIPNNVKGIHICNVPFNLKNNEIMQDDFLTKVDQYEVDYDGTIQHPDADTPILFTHHITTKTLKRDSVTLELIRKGKKITKDVALNNPLNEHFLVNRTFKLPKFFILGGLVFSPLTYEYISTFINPSSNSFYTNFPVRFRYWQNNKTRSEKEEEIIVLTQVLDFKTKNLTYDHHIYKKLQKINDTKIKCLNDVADIYLKLKENSSVKIDFKGGSTIITEKNSDIDKEILSLYNIKKQYHLENYEATKVTSNENIVENDVDNVNSKFENYIKK